MVDNLPDAAANDAASNIRRSGSESDMSQMGDTTCQYRVRKSSLIGYVAFYGWMDGWIMPGKQRICNLGASQEH